MTARLSPQRFAERHPIGTTMVVDETRAMGFINPVFWVGVITEHWRSPLCPDAVAGLPVLRLAVKPAAARLTEWWTIGKGYQRDQQYVVPLDEARSRFGDQPEFQPVPLCGLCGSGLDRSTGGHPWGDEHD
ncbi:hypothetical protein [Thermomonospora umbrina]|uniref:Uncharacterized protein n=1 Tax=Thermomonospora umbrina TaxID=111806 RepID=A0A3D9T5H3_9ACTN|nr:hypothetical protein [Thermomonospora umbrina]REF00496.1 hypothetical protein DFJ69_6040 [Thermomonospora umbrina]